MTVSVLSLKPRPEDVDALMREIGRRARAAAPGATLPEFRRKNPSRRDGGVFAVEGRDRARPRAQCAPVTSATVAPFAPLYRIGTIDNGRV